jgi:MFS family permease
MRIYIRNMSPLRVVPFRNLLAGLTVSQLGDVCFVVALPWLVLQMTGSSAVLGSILVAVAIPRAALMLVGGAVSDRIPAKSVLLAANIALTLCVAATAALAFHHQLALWMLFALAVVFGVADAFAMPAFKVLIPAIVTREQLPAANSMLASATQMCLLGGGAVAGILIQRFGVAPALAIDSCSFLFLIAAIARVKNVEDARLHTTSLIASVREGVIYAVSDASTRTLLLVIAAVNFCVTGATQVGVVALVHDRFGSAAYYGALLTTVAIGSLLGIISAGTIRLPSSAARSLLVVGAILGSCIAALALPLPIAGVFAVLFVCGLVAGFINVHVVSSLQANVPAEVRGRTMSLVSLSSVGLAPVSLAVSGVVAQFGLGLLFTASGACLLAVAAVGWVLLGPAGTKTKILVDSPASPEYTN